MAAQMLIGAALVVPGLLWTGLPAAAAWPWIVASTLMNVVTLTALLRAYELGGFGVVYPVVRAISILLIVPLAALLVGERLGLGAIAGVVLIALSLGVLSYGAGRGRDFSVAALAWMALTGLATAAYIACDARGVRLAGSAGAYGFAVTITNALAMGWRQRRIATPWRLIRGNAAIGAPVAVAAIVSYLVILWVWTEAPIAPTSALRDTSAVFAIIIAVLWLKEPFTRSRLLAVLSAAAAVPLLRLG
jgi:drug/metabolite transporter (DMT)-like permease